MAAAWGYANAGFAGLGWKAVGWRTEATETVALPFGGGESALTALLRNLESLRDDFS
jgi:hypothetical protein